MILNQICCLAFKFSLLEFEFFLQLIRPTMNSELKNILKTSLEIMRPRKE